MKIFLWNEIINYYNELLWQLGLSKKERNPFPRRVNIIKKILPAVFFAVPANKAAQAFFNANLRRILQTLTGFANVRKGARNVSRRHGLVFYLRLFPRLLFDQADESGKGDRAGSPDIVDLETMILTQGPYGSFDGIIYVGIIPL